MGPEEGSTPVDNVVTQFSTYEDFLDSQITTVDLYYLEDEGLARQLVELGYRGTGEVVKREDFEARKAAIETARLAERTQKKTLASAGEDLQDNFLKALAVREGDNRSGKVSSVIFIRDRNSHGQEVSGYIDYAHRLKVEDFEVYFSGKKRLLPKPTDMSPPLTGPIHCELTARQGSGFLENHEGTDTPRSTRTFLVTCLT
ncbi:cilia- and flagella-associated protein 299 isoform X4 [Phacochoerus africanus]|uniref:cilia- and flagella-associated protein 299 isoform X4 n=1 Tax=Phacochoerus africanus TaxID=41426 RepID=UPI001FDA8A5D|nr:cilia- and flagella-associated protein 299 isoform X4 [Phacochoerus africanus]